ncbi:unnamed protein product [marine sediment metagenome]|uniref:Holliday junction resolvase n=1 Tax=marine sediment metagenome TaxID=412755 RepID=X0ZK05_9ZZZZ
MFRNPIPKTQRPGKARYIIHNCHSPEIIAGRNWNSQDYVRFVSIDPGRANLAIRIEKRSKIKGGPIITEILDKYDIMKYEVDEEGISDLYQITNTILDRYRDLILQTHIILIEKQMPFNYKAVRISQHIISYFICLLKNRSLAPLIIEMDAKLKTDMLEAGKLNKQEVKKWAMKIGRELLETRNDKKGIELLDTTKGKLDDLCDTIVQIEAICVLLNLPVTISDNTENSVPPLNTVSPLNIVPTIKKILILTSKPPSKPSSSQKPKTLLIPSGNLKEPKLKPNPVKIIINLKKK